SEIAALYQGLEARALADVRRIAEGALPQWSRCAQMRYAGQGFEINVDLPTGPIDAGYGSKAITAFNEAYLRKHKFLDPEGTVEAVDWTLVATLPSRAVAGSISHSRAQMRGRRTGARQAWFPECAGYTQTRVIDRTALV